MILEVGKRKFLILRFFREDFTLSFEIFHCFRAWVLLMYSQKNAECLTFLCCHSHEVDVFQMHLPGICMYFTRSFPSSRVFNCAFSKNIRTHLLHLLGRREFNLLGSNYLKKMIYICRASIACLMRLFWTLSWKEKKNGWAHFIYRVFTLKLLDVMSFVVWNWNKKTFRKSSRFPVTT